MVDTRSWMVDIPPDWAMNAFCTKPNCLALHHKLLTYAGGEFYYADLGANIPTTGDIDFYYSPILASLRDFLSLFGAASVFCLSYTARDIDFSPFWQPVKNWNYWLALHRTFYWPTWLTFRSNGPFQIMSTYSCRFPALRPAGSSNQGQQDIDFSNNPCLDGPKVCS